MNLTKALATATLAAVLLASCTTANAQMSATDSGASTAYESAVFTPTSAQPKTSSDFDYYGMVKTIDGEPYTGAVLDYYESGSKKSKYHLKDGMAEGVWIDWHEEGPIRYYGEWKNGKGNGLWLYFHPNGEIRERSFAVDDVWTGVSEGWLEDGSKAFEALWEYSEPLARADIAKGETPLSQRTPK